MANQEQLSILKQGVEVWNRHQSRTPFVQIDLSKAKLTGMNLNYVNLKGAKLSGVDLSNAKLMGAKLNKANLNGANLSKANLRGAQLRGVNLSGALLCDADLSNANLREAQLSGTDLSGANLTDSILNKAVLVRAKVNKAKVSRSSIYAINVWELQGEFDEQTDLLITRKGQPVIRVDNIEVAQFIYLILNNEKIRDAINTLTSKSVLILGRFSIPERKAILDTLRNKLREYNLLPIVFDFDRPIDKDFTETIKTLAGLCYFVIADVTNPKSSPLELQATVPDYQIPFVPIIQEGESPFAMMVDLQKKYNWVLNTVSYDSQETLMKVLKSLIIDPAMKKRQELRLIKAQEPEVISGKDYLKKGGK